MFSKFNNNIGFLNLKLKNVNLTNWIFKFSLSYSSSFFDIEIASSKAASVIAKKFIKNKLLISFYLN